MIFYPHLGRNGRLGNQLFQIAGTLGLANTFQMPANFPNWSYSPYFSIPHHLFSNQGGVPASVLATQLPKRHRIYLQDFRLFQSIASTIRTYFSPSPTMKQRLIEKYSSLLKIPDKTAVHIRRTDFTQMQASYVSLGLAHYEFAMRHLKNEFPTTEFLIFSDDIEWCRKNFQADLHFVSQAIPFELNAQGLPSGNSFDADELFLMSQCEHHICSNSTYAWWSAFLSDDPHPIIPANWYGPDMNDMSMDQLLVPGWTMLDQNLNLKVVPSPELNHLREWDLLAQPSNQIQML